MAKPKTRPGALSGNPSRRPPPGWPRLLGRFVLVGVLLLLIGGGIFLAGVQVWAQLQYRRALSDLEGRRFLEAQARLQQCQRIWPDDSQVCFQAARAARLARDYPETER